MCTSVGCLYKHALVGCLYEHVLFVCFSFGGDGRGQGGMEGGLISGDIVQTLCLSLCQSKPKSGHLCSVLVINEQQHVPIVQFHS